MRPRIASVSAREWQVSRLADESAQAVSDISDTVDRRMRRGAFADMPGDGQGSVGDEYQTTDGGMWKHNGSVWRPIRDGIECTRPPPASAWSVVSHNAFRDADGAIIMGATNGAGTPTRGVSLVKLTANTTCGSVEAGFDTDMVDDPAGTTEYGYGLTLYNPTGTQTVGAEYRCTLTTTSVLHTLRLGYSTTLSGAGWTTSAVVTTNRAARFIRFVFRQGNIDAAVSRNRKMWYRFNSYAASTAISNGPTHVGLHCFFGGVREPGVFVDHFEQREQAAS